MAHQGRFGLYVVSTKILFGANLLIYAGDAHEVAEIAFENLFTGFMI